MSRDDSQVFGVKVWHGRIEKKELENALKQIFLINNPNKEMYFSVDCDYGWNIMGKRIMG